MRLSVEILICIICAFGVMVEAQNACRTPIREAGKCVPIYNCYVHVEIGNNSPRPLSPKIVEYVKKSLCEVKYSVHYVCCAERHILPDSDAEGPDYVTIPKAEQNEGHPSLRLINSPNCGRILEDKVSNGNNTELGEFPWVVQLLYDTPDGLAANCSGSLISKRYVLTAAHCVIRLRSPLVAIRLGEHDTSKDKDCYKDDDDDCMPPVQDIPVEEIIYHHEFNKPEFANDIAVIRMRRDAHINNESVLPICLPATKALQNNPIDLVTITGWGLTETYNPASILQKAVLPVVNNEECQLFYKRITQITTSQMCAGGQPGVDSCKGDSGGPLFYIGRVQTVRYVQYGIVSFGLVGCGTTKTHPGIYARVPYYMKWILDQMKP